MSPSRTITSDDPASNRTNRNESIGLSGRGPEARGLHRLLTHFLECVDTYEQVSFNVQIAVWRLDQPDAVEHLGRRVGHVHHGDGAAERAHQPAAVCVRRMVGRRLRPIVDGRPIAEAGAAARIELGQHRWRRRPNDWRPKDLAIILGQQLLVLIVKLRRTQTRAHTIDRARAN